MPQKIDKAMHDMASLHDNQAETIRELLEVLGEIVIMHNWKKEQWPQYRKAQKAINNAKGKS